MLLLLPQRYKFSSKSQRISCLLGQCGVVVATAKVQIFKQITTYKPSVHSCEGLLLLPQRYKFSSKSQRKRARLNIEKSCCCYRKGTNFQANHNTSVSVFRRWRVVVATAKVQIFKQITTNYRMKCPPRLLLLLPQRYKFSSKSQPRRGRIYAHDVVVATAKVQIFKQITTHLHGILLPFQLLLLPQRYKFSSKSQHIL